MLYPVKHEGDYLHSLLCFPENSIYIVENNDGIMSINSLSVRKSAVSLTFFVNRRTLVIMIQLALCLAELFRNVVLYLNTNSNEPH